MAALPVDQADVRKKIEELIERDGLETVTSSKIRAHLKSAFDVDFVDCKKAVDEVTKDVIENIQKTKSNKGDSKGDSDSDDDVPAAASDDENGDKPGKSAQDESSDDSDHGLASTERARPAKKATKRKAVDTDDANLDLMSAIKTGRRAAAKQAANSLKKIGGWRAKEVKEGAKKRDTGKIGKGTKLIHCSEELQAITGQRFMRRCDVVKSMWNYVKENERMDPKDKRYARIEGDAKLENLFKGRKRLQMFGVMGTLGHRHVINPADVSDELVEEAEAFKEQLIAEYEARAAAADVPEAGNNGAVATETAEDGGEEDGKEAEEKGREEDEEAKEEAAPDSDSD